MRILLLGARGQLGRALFSALNHDAFPWEVVALGRGECDIADPRSLTDALNRHRPDVIINGAAYTAVDLAQAEPELAESVNHAAVMTLAQEAKARNALLVHFSTDYVFDGSGVKPWNETDKACPLNVYGASKYAGDQVIQALCPDHLIFRTSWLYGGEGPHFARTILCRARAGIPLQVVDDQWGAPTQVHWLARVAVFALTQVLNDPGKRGLYHLACGGETSWYGFASALVREACRLGLLTHSVPINPIPSANWPQAARRPLNSRLDCRLFSNVFGIRLPSWQKQMTLWLASQDAYHGAEDVHPFP
ncbi:dTDP-4-dehydrorhamnose reductase [Aeromonas media]|uniref:dTDP-4-dehydrorhamnose reductase n=1 Tax=Aeromonas media TaxID=651 RepID=UPI0011170A20|nr:dTDP-4-dehydrorhamnose reductase [Aeromonas media]TNI63517.1 dTDP-4-dehydrorhamnose reductase [Aeromonas media]